MHRSPPAWPLAFLEVSEPRGTPAERDRHHLCKDEATQDGKVLYEMTSGVVFYLVR